MALTIEASIVFKKDERLIGFLKTISSEFSISDLAAIIYLIHVVLSISVT